MYELIREVYEVILPQCLIKQLDVHIYVDCHCNKSLIGPDEQIKQILINLLGNSAKFTEKGYVSISVIVLNNFHNKQELLFNIKDTGIGISETNQKLIFKPFIQADSSITKKYGGTGLGISISNELCKIMGGNLSLKSKLNRGSEFLFRIILDTVNDDIHQPSSNTQIFAYSLSEKCNSILKYYSENNEIITLNKFDNFNSVEQSNFVLLIEEDVFNNLSAFEKNKLCSNTSSKILIISEHKYRNNKSVISSIKYNDAPKELNNAINICEVFRINNTSEKTVLPTIKNNLKILFAEDDPTLQEVDRLLLSNTEHKVKIVPDGLRALEELNTEKYDLVILDLHMPKISGLDVIQQFQKLNNNLEMSTILLTADNLSSEKYAEYKKLFDSILVKPITSTKLLNTIDEITSKKIKVSDNGTSSKLKENIYNSDKVVNYEIIDLNINTAGVDEIFNLLNIYDSEVNTQLTRLKTYILNDDINSINKILHQLKGASFSIGANAFGMIVSNLCNSTNSYSIKLTDSNSIKYLNEMHLRTMNEYRNYLSNKFL